jgi:hypothetical protein
MNVHSGASHRDWDLDATAPVESNTVAGEHRFIQCDAETRAGRHSHGAIAKLNRFGEKVVLVGENA